jgi:hypothetical protein
VVLSDRESASALAGDVRGFGELLYQAATGRKSEDQPRLATGNAIFDALVLKCLSSTPDVDDSYLCLADQALWRDLQKALDAEARDRVPPNQRLSFWRRMFGR